MTGTHKASILTNSLFLHLIFKFTTSKTETFPSVDRKVFIIFHGELFSDVAASLNQQ